MVRAQKDEPRTVGEISKCLGGGWGVCRKTNTHLGPRVFVSLLFSVYSAVFGA